MESIGDSSYLLLTQIMNNTKATATHALDLKGGLEKATGLLEQILEQLRILNQIKLVGP